MDRWPSIITGVYVSLKNYEILEKYFNLYKLNNNKSCMIGICV